MSTKDCGPEREVAIKEASEGLQLRVEDVESAVGAAEMILTERPLCKFCLGSHVALLMKPVANWIKGELILKICSLSGGKSSENASEGLAGECWICGGLMPHFIEPILSRAVGELKTFEFSTIKSGTVLPVELLEREDELRAMTGLWTMEAVKVTLNKYVDSYLSDLFDVTVSPELPDVLVLIDMRKRSFSIRPSSIYVFGRYEKLKRGIYQSKWRSSPEGGELESVEELIGTPMKRAYNANGYVLHAAGREDVDARMLGNGRPFVMELLKPRKREVDLRLLQGEVNRKADGKVKVTGLRSASKRAVVLLKEASHLMRKRYRALIEVQGGASDEEVEKIRHGLSNVVIEQRTPTRVSARRADKVRKRKVHGVRIDRLSKSELELTLECDGGLYIKELIDGDEGRTRPSVSDILRKEAFCKELDVIEVIVPDEMEWG